jgi:hypothetical protein
MKNFLQQSVSRLLVALALLFYVSISLKAADEVFSVFEPLNESSNPSNYVLEPIPTFRIEPADVVQRSIRHMRISDKKYAVMWEFTEDAAKMNLAFRDAHKD